MLDIKMLVGPNRYEVLETQNDIYVVMEYISGGELFELVFRKGKVA